MRQKSFLQPRRVELFAVVTKGKMSFTQRLTWNLKLGNITQTATVHTHLEKRLGDTWESEKRKWRILENYLPQLKKFFDYKKQALKFTAADPWVGVLSMVNSFRKQCSKLSYTRIYQSKFQRLKNPLEINISLTSKAQYFKQFPTFSYHLQNVCYSIVQSTRV